MDAKEEQDKQQTAEASRETAGPQKEPPPQEQETRRTFLGQGGSLITLLALVVAGEAYRRHSGSALPQVAPPSPEPQQHPVKETPPVEDRATNGNKHRKDSGIRGEINVTDQDIVTSIMRAAEPLSAELSPDLLPRPARLTFAAVEDYDESSLPLPAEDLLPLIAEIRVVLAKDARLARLATEVRRAFGDGETLKILFQQLFPGQEGRQKRKPDGSPLLTLREVAVLREVAADRTHEEIGTRLHIAPRTVSTHLNHIYAKLHVQRPLQAVARAISMGYLDLDALDIVSAAGNVAPRNYSLFDTIATSMYDLNREQAAEHLRPLAEFGLLLVLLAGGTEFLVRQEEAPLKRQVSLVCEIDAKGEVIRSFGADVLRGARIIAIAPPAAARQGFTPGHLYVCHCLPAQDALNIEAFCEFTPDGRFVRTFTGGKEIGTRLYNVGGVSFYPDGRLLVPSGGWTDSVLAFSSGGAGVRRFLNLCSPQITVGPDGRLYAIRYSSAGSQIHVYEPTGRFVGAIAASSAASGPTSVVVNSRGHLWVMYAEAAVTPFKGEEVKQAACTLREYAPDGALLQRIEVPGLYNGCLAIDAEDRVYAPCSRSREVKVFAPDGTEVRQIHLRGKIVPYSVAVAEDGRVWAIGNVD